MDGSWVASTAHNSRPPSVYMYVYIHMYVHTHVHTHISIRGAFRAQGITFYSRGVQLMGQDVQLFFSMISRAVLQGYTLRTREVNIDIDRCVYICVCVYRYIHTYIYVYRYI